MEFYQKHKTFWDKTAPEMYLRWSTQDPWMTNIIVPAIESEVYPPQKLLDIGCGQGILYDRLPESVRTCYTGMDFSQSMLDVFSKRQVNANVVLDDIIDSKLPDFFADVSVCLNTLMYFDKDLPIALSTINRLTTRLSFLSVPVKESKRIDEQHVNSNISDLIKMVENIFCTTNIDVSDLLCNNYVLMRVNKK